MNVQVNLVEPGLTQNYANISNVGLQESVLTTQNVFETVPDLLRPVYLGLWGLGNV